MSRKINIKEILIILLIGCCTGVVFNLFHENRISFIAPSKAEIYARKNIPGLTMEEAKARFDAGGAIFLDARDPHEYQEKHVKGALNLPVRHIELYYPKMKGLLPKDADIVVYCIGEECNASLYLAEELIKLKYENIKVMLGGWEKWEEAGYPAE